MSFTKTAMYLLVALLCCHHTPLIAQICGSSAPSLDAGNTFQAFDEFEQVLAREGSIGDEWEWGIGKNIGSSSSIYSDSSSSASKLNLDRVSGELLDWKVAYQVDGSATLTINRPGQVPITTSFANVNNPIRGGVSGNAVRFLLKLARPDGSHLVSVWPQRIDGYTLSHDLANVGTMTKPEASLVYFLPASNNGRTISGQMSFTFPNASPTAGVGLKLSVQLGNITCPNSLSDIAKPKITALNPNNNALVSGNKPTIKANFQGGESEVDLTKVLLTLDGVSISAQSIITATGISFTPSSAIDDGPHNVSLTVVDKANNSVTSNWAFVTDSKPPEITSQAPQSKTLADIFPNNIIIPITAHYRDLTSGVDRTKITLTLDGVDLTAQSNINETNLSYTPSVPYAVGTHNIRLTVYDKRGGSTQANWQFIVVDSGSFSIINTVPKNTTLPADDTLSVSAGFAVASPATLVLS
ncbi:MAG: hypothetical protein RLZZ502_590, partial [Pseudomonadota bacterium]